MERHNPRERVAEHHVNGNGVARVGYPIGIRTAPVAARELITPRMLRLTLKGPELEGFHSYQADDHVKIVFPDADGTLRLPVPNDEQMLDWPDPSPTTRTYTIRRYDADSREIDLDIVLHDGGVAATWAATVQVGDEVSIAGPPGAKAFPHTYGHYVFAVDATALPAAARWLEESPPGVSAHLVIETGDPAEHAYPLAERDGVEVIWLVREGGRSSLADTVRSLTLPEVPSFLFAAGEAGDIRPLRQWSAGRLDSLFTGYWKRGVAGLED
ncbi:siderophore-interacting protein [Nonomuraea sp. NPDC049486]|uniref:siderophore-interacting protein n=1 Tax=Nonomuraea sp. NPDC049486 TaxID=3155773 RepID=UPI00341E1C17